MSNTNTEIWDGLFKTDPAYTKAGKVNGQHITSISPMYVIKVLTEMFGPAGKGWGYDIREERFNDGSPIFDKDNKQIANESMHSVLLDCWYMLDGEKQTIPPQYGHTPFIMRTKFGPSTDFDAPKKSISDALKKSFSMIGVSADIYLGMFDDSNYVEQRNNEEALSKADDRDAEAMKQKEEYEEWRSNHLETFSNSVSKNESNKLFTLIARKMERYGDQQGLRRLNQIKEDLAKKFEG